MFNTILNNVKSNEKNFSYLTDVFSLKDGLAYKLVEKDFDNPKFLRFEDMSVIHANEIIKGFRFFIKLSAVYLINEKEEVFTFALDCSSNKSYNNLIITDLKMK